MNQLITAAIENPFLMKDGSILFLPTAIVAIVALVWLGGMICGTRLMFQIGVASKFLKSLTGSVSADSPQVVTNILKSGTLGRLSRAISEAITSQNPTEIREIVSQMAVRESNRRAAAFLSFAVGSVLILGLMGTFLAFGELVHRSGLGGDSFAEGIPVVVRNLNLAFIASVAGVLASITLHLFSAVWVKPQRLSFLADLEDLLIKSHAKAASELLGSNQIPANSDLLETLRGVATQLSTAVGSISTVAQRFEKLSLTTPESMADTLEAVRVEIEQGSVRYGELVEIATNTKNAVEGMSDRAGEALEDVVKKHGEAQLSMYEQASEFSKKLLAQISEEDEVRLTTYREGIRETADKIALVADSWKTDSTNLVTAFQSERTSYIESLKAAGEDSASRMEANSKQSHEAVSEIASTMTSTCGTIAAEAVGRLEDAYNKQINDWSKSAEIATRQNNAAQQTLEILESRLAPMAESIQTLHAETVATLSSAGASADGIAKVPALFDDLIGKYAEGMDLLSVEAAKMSSTVNSLGRDAEGVFHTTGEQLGQISVQLNQVIKLGQNSGYETKPSWVKKLGNWTRQKFTRSKQS